MDIKNPVYELKNTRTGWLAKMEAAMGKDKAAFDAARAEVVRLNAEIDQQEALLAERGRFEDGDGEMAARHALMAQRKRDEAFAAREDRARAGGQYAEAFVYALANGISVKKGKHDERCAPLYAALKETGGTPDGADGGFLVPVDMDTRINAYRRELSPLADLFTVETVSALTGWRVLDKAPTLGFTAVDELDTIPQDDQPMFSKVNYKVSKYGLIVPISRELLDDNTANLLEYLAGWFAKKAVITENKLLLNLLAGLTPGTVAVGDEVKAIKRALNVTLDPAISAAASMITNQSGFSVVDELVDDSGKPLLQPDIASPTQYRLLGRDVRQVPNRFLGNGAGTTPIYLGDFMQYATLFRRKAFELASTDVGGNAWRTDSMEVRGLMRLDAKVFDAEAAVALNLPTMVSPIT